MREFLIALQFLTTLPVKIERKIKEEEYGRSLGWFPAAGITIGIVLVSVSYIFGFLPSLALAAVILAASVLITGGIHLDGFADTCDSLAGFTTKERDLEIMRDSRVSAMGAIGILTLLPLTLSLLAGIPKDGLWKALIVMPAFARWSQALACYSSKYARADGKAKYFIEHAGRREVITGAIVTLILALLLMNVEGVGIFLISFFLILLFITFINRKFGGMTGDTIGAVNEIAEVLVLCLSLIFVKR